MAEKTNLVSVCQPSQTYVFPFTTRRYRQLASEGVVPPVVNGNINLLLACRMLLEHQQKVIEGRGTINLSDEKKRLVKINADRKEFELERMKGEFIRVSAVEKAEFEKARIFRDHFLNITNRILAIYDAEPDQKNRHELIEKEMRAILDDYVGRKEGKENIEKRSKKRS